LEDFFSLRRFQRDGGIEGFPKERRNRYRLTGSTVLLCRNSLKEERKEKCLAVSDDAPMLHPFPYSPMNILTIGTSFSNAPWTVGGSNLWVSVLYLGFLLYVLLSFRSGQTELYFLTVTKEESPILYWSTMGIITIAAVVLGFYLLQNLF